MRGACWGCERIGDSSQRGTIVNACGRLGGAACRRAAIVRPAGGTRERTDAGARRADRIRAARHVGSGSLFRSARRWTPARRRDRRIGGIRRTRDRARHSRTAARRTGSGALACRLFGDRKLGWVATRNSRSTCPSSGRRAIEGYFLATGHYRNGILLAPATARVDCRRNRDGRRRAARAVF